MGITLIVILSFILLFILFNRFLPGKNLDEILLEEEEEPRFDEQGITIMEQPSHGESTSYPRSRISVTNRRVIISQLPLLAKRYHIIMILYFADAEPPEKTGLEGRIKTGVLVRDEVQLVAKGKQKGVHLHPRNFSLFNRDSTTIIIRTEQKEALVHALERPRLYEEEAQR